jgi:hypothetical protein
MLRFKIRIIAATLARSPIPSLSRKEKTVCFRCAVPVKSIKIPRSESMHVSEPLLSACMLLPISSTNIQTGSPLVTRIFPRVACTYFFARARVSTRSAGPPPGLFRGADRSPRRAPVVAKGRRANRGEASQARPLNAKTPAPCGIAIHRDDNQPARARPRAKPLASPAAPTTLRLSSVAPSLQPLH